MIKMELLDLLRVISCSVKHDVFSLCFHNLFEILLILRRSSYSSKSKDIIISNCTKKISILIVSKHGVGENISLKSSAFFS